MELITTLAWNTGSLRTPGEMTGAWTGKMANYVTKYYNDTVCFNLECRSSQMHVLCRYFHMQRGKNMCGIATCASYPVVWWYQKEVREMLKKEDTEREIICYCSIHDCSYQADLFTFWMCQISCEIKVIMHTVEWLRNCRLHHPYVISK